MEHWPAFRNWTREYLVAAFGDKHVHARGADLPLSEYFKYSDSTKDDVTKIKVNSFI